MYIPVGAIVQLIERLLSRPNFDAPATPHMRGHQVAMMLTAAQRLGGEFKDYGHRFVMMFGGTRVEVKFLVADDAIHKMSWSVGAAPPGFPVFRIGKRDALAFARKKVPRGSVPLLDPYYLVQTNDPESVRLLWTEDVCQMLARTSSAPLVRSDGQMVDISCAASGHPDVLDAGVRLCLALARSDVYASGLLRELPDSTFVEQQLPFAHIPGPGHIRVGYFRAKDIVVTRALAAISQLGEAATERAKQLGATTAIENGEVVLAWQKAVRDKRVLLEVVELLRTAASPSQGVFR